MKSRPAPRDDRTFRKNVFSLTAYLPILPFVFPVLSFFSLSTSPDVIAARTQRVRSRRGKP